MNSRVNKQLMVLIATIMASSMASTVFSQEYFYHPGFKTDRKIADFAFVNDGKEVLVTEKSGITRYAIRTGKQLSAFSQGHRSRILAMDISGDQQLLVTGGMDSTIILWDPAQGTALKKHRISDDVVMTLSLSPDKQQVAIGGLRGEVVLYDLVAETVTRRINDHEGDITTVKISQDGQLLGTAGADNTIRIYGMPEGELLATLRGHTDWVRDISFDFQGNRLYSCSDDRHVIIWDITDLSAIDPVRVTKTGMSWLTSIDVHPDGNTYASGNIAGAAMITTPFEFIRSKTRYPVNRIAFVPGNHAFYRIMAATEGNGLKIYDARDMAGHDSAE